MIYGSKVFDIVNQLAGIAAESSTGAGFLPGFDDAVPLHAFGALTGPFTQQGPAVFTLIADFSLGHFCFPIPEVLVADRARDHQPISQAGRFSYNRR